MNTVYLSVADTAKHIRAALKASFPGVKFSVKSRKYSGGASIDVAWTDGPAGALVDAVTGQFQGGRFDASIDLAYSVKHWMLPDGTVTIASDPGTHGSGGSHAPAREWMPAPDAKLVSFGAKHVFTRRTYTAAFLRRVMARLAARGLPVETVELREDGWGARIRAVDFSQEATRGFDMERAKSTTPLTAPIARGGCLKRKRGGVHFPLASVRILRQNDVVGEGIGPSRTEGLPR